MDEIKKEAYYERIEAELKRWDEEIKKLKENTKNVESGTETQYYEQVEDLIALHELAQQKLQELRESEDKTWNDFKAGMDAAMDNLSHSHEALISHFK